MAVIPLYSLVNRLFLPLSVSVETSRKCDLHSYCSKKNLKDDYFVYFICFLAKRKQCMSQIKLFGMKRSFVKVVIFVTHS